MTAPFTFDTSKPVPGEFRMPDDTERRTYVYFKQPFRDCTTLCEVNPDLEEYTDATMRMIVASPDCLKALDDFVAHIESRLSSYSQFHTIPLQAAKAALLRAKKGDV